MKINNYSENNDQGWVKLFRSLKNKAWFNKSAYVHIWVYLLIDVNHKGKDGIFFGNPIKLKPGQTLTGRKIIAKNTGIHESKVERLLSYFEKKEHQIEQQKSNKNRIITVLNWNMYQNTEQQLNNNRTTTEQQLNTNKNERKKECKERKEEKDIVEQDSTIFNFEEIWNQYPKKDGRKIALKHFNATVKTNQDFENIKKALINYAKHIKANNKQQYIKNGSTWFNNWQDWIEWNEIEIPKTGGNNAGKQSTAAELAREAEERYYRVKPRLDEIDRNRNN